ncbi:MAG: putative prophage major tail sheath protein [Stenotrophomonas maltophilia]|uniref:Putative prophage major tail sheath protein n=1 Tax=Stenotrophomonas maltophilia TaxID=40324 RepID=A0A7V8JNF3_STEMA|nr:MAG: putative prophage major tail sheath protein [Stenotrophomonas maltophilia]
MSTEFLHGVEVLTIDDGVRPIQTASSSVIGIVGTAPRADAVEFPINTPVMVAGSRAKAAKLLKLDPDDARGDGTLPEALDSIFDQTGAAVIVVRVEEGASEAETLSHVLGGANATTGGYEGIQALLAAKSVTGYKPRILCAPGFTHQSVVGGITAVKVTDGGEGYKEAPTVKFSGGEGSGAAAEAMLKDGKVSEIKITNPGSGYTSAPTVDLLGGRAGGSAHSRQANCQSQGDGQD